MAEQFEISLSDAAQRLGMSWGRAWRLVLTGKLRGTKREGDGLYRSGVSSLTCATHRKRFQTRTVTHFQTRLGTLTDGGAR